MGQGERIEWINPCPLTPSSKRSLRPQGIRMRLNLHFRPNPILVVVSLALILMACGLVIFWMLIGAELYAECQAWPGGPGAYPTLELFEVVVVTWFLMTLGVGLIAGLNHIIGWIDRGQTRVREFNKTKATSTIVEEERGERKGGEERELKHLKTTFLVVLLIVIGVAITPQFAETAGDAQVAETAGDASSIMNLKGPRIWIFGEGVPESGEYTISADEYAHLHHGWNSKGQYSPKINWSELSELEMNEFIETSTFELTINGDPIELSCARWLDVELDVCFVIYYIQFKPGDLATGTHTFFGTWYSEVNGTPYTDESGTCPITLNVTVNVV
ncbi:MAG: hypothetical protein ACFFCP_17360 [Promethearchaeota archaeon]